MAEGTAGGGPRTWFITGTSSGLGRALAEAALEAGERVVATARRAESVADLGRRFGERCIPLPLDVTDPAAVTAAVEEAVRRAGRIDVLVNNAGYGIVGALEEFDEETVKAAFDANVYGPFRVTKAVLPHMRAAGGGRILMISSMLGLVASPGFPVYASTKFALEGMSEALAGEVAPFGIRVTIVEPGPFRTAFRGAGLVMAPEMDVYADTVGAFRKRVIETDGQQPGDPAKAARAMIALADADDPPLRLPLGAVCIDALRGKLARVGEELDRWEGLGRPTSFDEG